MDENTFKLIAIDPGNNIGISIYTLKNITFEIVDIQTFTIILENRIPDYVFDKMFYKLQILNSVVMDLAAIHRPLAVGIELPFLNSRFPKAVMQLSQYVSVIEAAFYNVDPFIKFFKYPPKYIKAVGSGKGNADKNDMLKAVNNNNELNIHVNPNLLSEHEVDAILIGYTAILEIRQFPFCLYAL
jgi:Holliday junction resolvasome RuvABC endonuclease subunit